MCHPCPDCCQLQSSHPLGSALDQREWPRRLRSQASTPPAFGSFQSIDGADRRWAGRKKGAAWDFSFSLSASGSISDSACALLLASAFPWWPQALGSRTIPTLFSGFGRAVAPMVLSHGAYMASQIFHLPWYQFPVLKSSCYVYWFLVFWIDLARYREHGKF